MSTIQELDFSVDMLRALLWRNNEAPNLQALLEFKQANFDADSQDFWTNWVQDVFNLRTANEFGLNVWSIILGINITIEPTATPTPNTNWGFGPDRINFGTPINLSNFTPSVSATSLSLEDARLVLRLRYYQLTTNGNVSDINLILKDVFRSQLGRRARIRGLTAAYVTDNLDMTIHYTFLFQLSSSLQLVLKNFDILPRPAGVLVTFAVDFANNDFGFGGFRKNFENGNFTPN